MKLSFIFIFCLLKIKRDKLKEMILQFRRIYFSDPLSLYVASFENNEYYQTLVGLIETIIAQEMIAKK